MTTNITVYPVEGPAVVYFQDGTTETVPPQTEKSFQIIDEGFVTISDTPEDTDGSEHPPTGWAFANAMVAFWQFMMNKIKEANDPEVNPL